MNGPFPKPIYTINGVSSASNTGNISFLGAGGLTVSGTDNTITITGSGEGGNIPAPTANGQIPIGSANGTFSTKTLTAGPGIFIVNGPSTITISGNSGIVPPPTENGQIPIGSANGTFSIKTLTAGPGISIANGPGSITISGSAGTVPSPTANGQIPIGSANGIFTTKTLTAGPGISIANGPGSITISGSGGSGGLTWVVISANQTLESNHGYLIEAGDLSLALPTTSQLGDIISVVLDNGTSWKMTQSGAQQIKIGNASTTAGAAGSLTSTGTGDCVTLVCSAANTVWISYATQGNINIV